MRGQQIRQRAAYPSSLTGVFLKCRLFQGRLSKGTYLYALYHRLVPRRGAKKAIVAVAHSLLITVHHVLKNQVPYHELWANHFDKLNLTHIKRHHIRRLENLGFRVILEPLQKAA
jgi:hypothetical protein